MIKYTGENLSSWPSLIVQLSVSKQVHGALQSPLPFIHMGAFIWQTEMSSQQTLPSLCHSPTPGNYHSTFHLLDRTAQYLSSFIRKVCPQSSFTLYHVSEFSSSLRKKKKKRVHWIHPPCCVVWLLMDTDELLPVGFSKQKSHECGCASINPRSWSQFNNATVITSMQMFLQVPAFCF